jgi:hypothetical protein
VFDCLEGLPARRTPDAVHSMQALIAHAGRDSGLCEVGEPMKRLALVSTLAALFLVGCLSTGLAAGRAWGRAAAASAAHSGQRAQSSALEKDLAALERRLERHAEVQRQFSERALGSRVRAAGQRGVRRAELALERSEP